MSEQGVIDIVGMSLTAFVLSVLIVCMTWYYDRRDQAAIKAGPVEGVIPGAGGTSWVVSESRENSP